MCHCGAVVKLLERADKPGSTSGDAVFCFFVPFFFSVWSLFFFLHYFGLFFFILTADPAGHVLGSIYILSFSPEFYFGKKNTSAFVHRLNHSYYYTKISTGSVGPPEKIKRNLLLVFWI